VTDCFIIEGPKILFQISLAIFQKKYSDLMDARSDKEFFLILDSFLESVYDADALIKVKKLWKKLMEKY
jgi:hypothetical protein